VTFLLLLALLGPPCAGHVVRHKAPLVAFKRTHPCPATCATYVKRGDRIVLYEKCGACNVDHICPLACCGKDSPSNMQWLDAKENIKKGDNCRACSK
jgi:hypothetical protein